MANLGDNLSNYANLDYLEARSTEELLRQLQQIRLPHKIITIYAYGNKHVAWVSLTQKIKKIKKEE